MAFTSVRQLLHVCRENVVPIWKAAIEDDEKERGILQKDSIKQMETLWAAMKAADENYRSDASSASRLVGGDGGRMQRFQRSGKGIAGGLLDEVITHALKMGENNACMQRIVAAPTAGSCGVLPAVLIPVAEKYSISDSEIVKTLYVAACFGQIIASRASISGAEGGCQAEIGSASAMAAASLTDLMGGTPEMCAQACTMALMNLLGLVCDPVAGLVEIPCVKRNVIGAVNAVSCADMALAKIKSKIPPDEVIDAMRSVGEAMSYTLKETSMGGLATTPTGIEVANKLHGNLHRG